jgi:ribonuclease-3
LCCPGRIGAEVEVIMTSDPLSVLEDKLGYRFKNRALLLQALTHSSRKADLRCSNERMEFLGDAILGGAVSEHLYRRFPDCSEGELTRMKSAVVSRAALARVGKALNLGAYLIVAKGVAHKPVEEGEGEGDRSAALPPSLLSNAFEAVIAAVYLDSGVRRAYQFTLRHLKDLIERAAAAVPMHNAKSALQEYVQREMGDTPNYRVVSETGPDHGKWFEVVAVIGGKEHGAGQGRTKKEAEQAAAQRTLDAILKKPAKKKDPAP